MPENQLIAGRYRLLSPLGEGGMGVVWHARDEVLARDVAVKEVRAPAGLAPADERRLYRRLEREAWAAGRISHRNVAAVHDVATEDARPWIVMELIRGLTLSEVLEAEGPLPPQRAAVIGAEVLAALSAAHDAGVLHRDVKPENVLIAADGRVVLSDFGLATVAGAAPLTLTGELVGSPEFLAPERALGHPPGPAADLWSLGALLFTAVEGVTPFARSTPLATLRAAVEQELPPSRLSGELAPVITGLLRKEPGERLSAREASRLLRLAGAGGGARTGAPPTPEPYTREPGPEPHIASARPHGGPPPEPGAAEASGASQGAAVVLAVGVALLLLAVCALVWALIDGA
ncbi:serine/threonine-protein kinase [Streptomyces jumonjinensis]|uniref:serine/threonine-protein kinase n=1 Tax=Streptomyces jumonjinensis TaxID=1945 RepID=UPI00378DDA95